MSADAARALKAEQMLYMLTVLVDDTCAEEALQDDWMGDWVAQEARLCMYARRPGISPEKGEVLRRGIVAGRLE